MTTVLNESFEVLASFLGLSSQELRLQAGALIGELGIDSLSATRVRGALTPMPSYQVLYGLTVSELADLLFQSRNQQAHFYSEPTRQKEILIPFNLTPMQESYVMGANQGCPCQVYNELDVDNLNIELFQQAVRLVVDRHPMLHARIVNGTQQIILTAEERSEVFSFEIRPLGDPDKRRQECLEIFKARTDLYWDIKLSRIDETKVRIHLLIDMLFIDATSAMQLCYEVSSTYESFLLHGTPISWVACEFEFRDYCQQLIKKQVSDTSLRYWTERCDWMPGPPQLPRKYKADDNNDVNFQRASLSLNVKNWGLLKARAGELKVSPNSLLLAIFSEVLRFYSEEPDFSVAVTMSERPVLRENNFTGVVGEFTNVLLCAITGSYSHSIFERALAIHNEISQGLEHNDLSGLEFIRLLRKHRRDPHLSFPVVFTSFLGIVRSDLELAGSKTTLHFQQTQTPQITLDHQVYEFKGELRVNWDYDANVYTQNLIRDMLSCFQHLLEGVAGNAISSATLPPDVLNTRHGMNQTKWNFPDNESFLLHEMVLKAANESPFSIAVIDQDVGLSYNELILLARATTLRLQDEGVSPGSCVAVVMEKGWEQVVATLSILMAGAFYLPLNPSDPDERLRSILSLADCRIALVQEKTIVADRVWTRLQNESLVTTICVHRSLVNENKGREPKPVEVDPDQLAYVIFTSGSTGEPKGVEISHRGAANTCLDINQRYGLKNKTVSFAISSLSFDLSVWDIFGTLAAGGKIVICRPNGTRDPDYWWEQLTQHGVTVWNTVPTSFEMLIASRQPETVLPLKVALLSGDAISMSMVENVRNLFPDLLIVALGGATEASIWSNFHVVDENSKTFGTELVPYGRALSNQTMHVLDSRFEYRPTGVVGDIYIGGVGLARGYFRDPDLSASKFINCETLGRLYATGDLGRYLSNGEIEIVGRKDSQVKVGGHRVELGEIEQCAEQVPYVNRAAVVHISGVGARLIGFIVASEDREGLELEVRRHVEQHLPDYMSPQTWIALKEMPLTSNSKVDVKKLRRLALASTLQTQTQTQTDSSTENSCDVALILQFSAQLLGVPVDSLSPTQSLVEQGLSSLFAVQLINLLAESWHTRLPFSLIFNYPSAIQLANYLSHRNSPNSTENQSSNINITPVGHSSEPIAVVGIACRLPGSVTTPEDFWKMLTAGTDCMKIVPSSRFDIDEIYDPYPDAIGKSYTRHGAFIDQIENFDFEFFGIPIAEARAMDPQQRILLEVAYEAFHAAGYNKERLSGSSTGVFVGQMNYDWMMGDFGYAKDYAGTGSAPSITSNRISFTLNLAGPSITIDTACSSSLVAVDAAITKLQSGACHMALAGGVNLILHPQPYVTTCQARMLSINNRCATFDASANGIARGEGVGAVILKRLSDAQADGDKILALIRGSAVNQDGRSASLTAPNGLAQEAVIKRALNVAGIAGHKVDYVECHGTGTSLGDPIEIEAIKNVLGFQREKPIVLGSVKTNIGHLEGAAGIIGLIKAIQVLRNRKAPGNVHFKTLNPKIDLRGFSAVIPTKPIALGRDGERDPLFASVSSFGYGGTNAHVVLESWEQTETTKALATTNTLWIFAGQGSIVAGAAKTLYESNSVFHKALNKYTAFLTEKIGISILNLLIEDSNENNQLIQQTQHAQPAIVALQLAQIAMWQNLGLNPCAVIGHSIGEFTAAVVVGVMQAEQALELAAIRGRLMSECEPGGMLAVLASADELRSLLPHELAIAAENGPNSSVIAGSHEALQHFVEKLKDIPTSMLAVSHAFHSPMMKKAAETFKTYIKSSTFSEKNDIQFISTLTGEVETTKLLKADYWAEQIMQPVKFLKAFETVLSLSPTIERVVELGPDSTLINIAKRISNKTLQWIASSKGVQLAPASLFKPTRLAWKKPSAKQELKKPTLVERADNKDTESLYETVWINPEPKPEMIERAQAYGLLLSRIPVCTNLSKDWQSACVTDELDLSSLLATKTWPLIVFLSSGHEEDLSLGLKVLQLVQNTPTKQIIFVSSPASTADAGLWGLARCFRLERPDLRIRCVECTFDHLSEALGIAANYENEDELTIDKDGLVQVRRLAPYQNLETTQRLVIHTDASYVISGGLGALGLLAAKLLVERGAKYLLLLSRSLHSEADLPQELVELRKLANIECLACDVSQEANVLLARDWLLDHHWPVVRGIVHAAGILTDATIANQSTEKLNLAFGVKVHGACHLRSTFMPRDFLVLYSSIAASFGSIGQASYAAANATLDALARTWTQQDEPVLSIQWGAWSDAGMAVRHEAVKRIEAAGFGSISNKLGTSILEQLLASGKRGTICASPIDWTRLSKYNPQLGRLSVLKEEFESTKSTWSRPLLQQMVRDCILQFLPPSSIEGNPSFIDAGFSSLDLVQFRQQLLARLPEFIELPVHFAFNYPTEQDVIEYLFEQFKTKSQIRVDADGVWKLLNGVTTGSPLFLVSGIMGTVEKTFGALASAMSVPVYAAKPAIPAVIDLEKISLESLARNLLKSMLSEVPGHQYTIGGMSFGAAIALEMGLQLESEGKLTRVVMLDPRHMPLFKAPENAAPFEILLQHYKPSGLIHCPVLVFQCAVPPIEKQSEMMREASRSFQDDSDVLERCREYCPSLEIIPNGGHHFNFLYKHFEPIAARLNKELKQVFTDHSMEPIAVIGMACRLPNNVRSPREFWDMLAANTDCVSEIPFARFDIDEVYDPNPNAVGKSYTRRGAFMDQVEYFDHQFFGISLAEARVMDPQQRLLLEVAYEAFHTAGYDKESLRGSSTSVHVGLANDDWTTMGRDHEAYNPHFGAGVSGSIASNRISYILGLTGPSMTLDTACSSSLVAIDLAVEKLRSGISSMALVGGVNVILHHRMFVSACATKALSINGHCATFDESADGYCRGEGVGAVVLKRLSQAKADGDPILAVIRGTAVNQDGRSASLTAPNGLAQEAVIKQALSVAGLNGCDIDYVECHGTGTPLGDPIELAALKSALNAKRTKPLVLGAVKTNIGHLEGAAGVVGLIKTIEVLRHRKAPGNLHFKTLNPKINLDAFAAVIPTETVSLSSDQDSPLLAGISSFGFGGTNAHVVLESYNGASTSPTDRLTYNPRYLPWRRFPHPFLSRKEGESFATVLLGEQAEMWKDHRIGGRVLIPAASHISMLGGAVLLKHTNSNQFVGVEVNEILMLRPLFVEGDNSIVRCINNASEWSIENEYKGVRESIATSRTGHLLQKKESIPQEIDIAVLKERYPAVKIDELYATLSHHGVQFGPNYRNITELYLGSDEGLARIHVEYKSTLDRSLSLLHPATIDAGIQLLGFCALRICGVCIPFSVRSAQLFSLEEQASTLWAHARISSTNNKSVEGTVTLFNEQGDVLVRLDGLVCRQANVDTQVNECLFETEWLPLTAVANSHSIRDTNPLVLSSLAIDTSRLPQQWQCVVVDDSVVLESLLSNNTKSPIIVLGNDSELDVALGLQVLQLAAVNSKIFFVTAPSSTADAGLWGLARTFRLERSDIRVRCLFCEIEGLSDAIHSAENYEEEDELSFSKEGSVYVPRLYRCNDTQTANQMDIHPDATYVISGGLGALGLVLAKLLVDRGAKFLLLLSRRSSEVPELFALRERAKVECFACDVSQEDDVLKARDWLLQNHWPAVSGLAHAAGVLSDATIPNQTLAKLRLAYGAKVHGARHLKAAFMPKDFLVLFSSAAAIFGSAGQASYAAANATLDALANQWSQAGDRVLSIQWGAWSDAGMAVRHDAVKRGEAAGFGSIPDSLGRAVLEQLLSSNKSGTVCVSPIDWNRLNIDMPLISLFKPKRDRSVNVRREETHSSYNIIDLLNLVRAATTEAIGRQVADDDPLMASGLDSLGAVVLAQTLSQKLNLSLGSIFALNHPTIHDMVQNLLPLLGTSDEPLKVASPEKSHRSEEPIAIVGMACRLPGDVKSPKDFWNMLIAGTDCVSEVPLSRFDIDEVYNTNPDAVGCSYTRKAAFISNVENFDNDFFGISVPEARTMDPHQRLLLEVAYEAFHSAGYDKKSLRGSATSVFVGVANQDWMIVQGDKESQNPFFGTGVSSSIISNRISHLLGLTGPSMTIDTACSSSLVAVDLAVDKLRNGLCSKALVGGVNIMLHHRTFVGCCAAKMLSANNHCATFDESADGYCRGEGAGAVVLKRLSEALSDGDPILAIIRGSAVNQDGRSGSLTTPNGPAQEAVIKQALAIAGLSGRELDYVECHGTGTLLGDPIEVGALKNVLSPDRDKPVVLGAVKTNIGHLEGAAGVVGLIKAVLVVNHREAPANVHFKTLNPKIDLKGFSAIIPNSPVQLGVSSTAPLIAGVSSFGFGGTNAHILIESYNGLQNEKLQTNVPYSPRFLPWRRLPHPLLTRRDKLDFVCVLSGEQAEMWKDHRVGEDVLVPAASHVLMLGGAALLNNISNSSSIIGVELLDVLIPRPLVLRWDDTILRCVVDAKKSTVQAEHKANREEYASCQSTRILSNLDKQSCDIDIESVKSRCLETDIQSLYVTLSRQGMQFGPRYRNLTSLFLAEHEALAQIHVNYDTAIDKSLTLVHPATLDAGIQLLALCGMKTCGISIPFNIKVARLFTVDEQPNKLWAYASISSINGKGVEGTVTLFNEQGAIFAILESLACRKIGTSQLNDALFEIEWTVLPAVSNHSPRAKNQYYVLSQNPLTSPLPLNWKTVLFNSESEDLLSLLPNVDAANLVMLSSGSEKDLSLGLKLLQTLSASSTLKPKQIVFATSTGSTADAGLWGLARTFRLERPDIRLRTLECDLDMLSEAVSLLSEHEAEDELSVDKNGNARVPRLCRLTDLASQEQVIIRSDRSYVISGGQGSLGLVSAKLLVEQGARYILLLSRSVDSSKLPQEILELREHAQVECIACDVSQEESVLKTHKWLKNENWPLVGGIIHAAGVLTDATIPNQTTEMLTLAYGVKVHGAQNLRSIFQPLDFLVLFSSASATFGSAGQGSYAAANATLDALAKQWSQAGETVLSVQWGAWSDVGMAVRHAAVKRAEAAGFGSISNSFGTEVLKQLLHSRKSGIVCVSPIDWHRITLDIPLISRFRPKNKPTVDKESTDAKRASYDQTNLSDLVRRTVAEAIGKPVADDEPLMASGLDSLGAVFLAQTLSQKLDLALGSVFALNHPSIREMVDNLIPRLESGRATVESVPTLSKKQRSEEPIAIVSSACRLPGNVMSPEEFWNMLVLNTDCVDEIPFSRFDIDEVYDPNPDAVGRSYTRRGAFMEEVESFDHEFFGIPIIEARSMDPQQRLLLEVAYEAFYSAGYDKDSLRSSSIGVFVGQMNHDWAHMNKEDQLSDPYFGAGSSASITSNRISYLLGLTGPSMTLDTACSSSLVAVDLAVDKLRNGTCSAALVGGVNVMLHHRTFVGCCAAKMLSKIGRCATFDESADGYCRGEGVGAVVLKRLSDAQANGDQILAVIRGSAVNQDGRSASLTAPNGLAQEAVIKQALELAGLSGSDVDYVECHGTGTSLGDPIEVGALKNVLGVQRNKPVLLGAVKTNIGHLEGAAGVIGLIKAIEVLRHRAVPGNVHFKTLNPKIDLEGFAAAIPTQLTPLGVRSDRPLVAGVSSFGFGGTNAHVVLESWDSSQN